MGQWYNRSLASVPCVPKAPSSRIKDKVPLLYSYRQLAEPAMKDWRVNAYIRCSFDVINKTGLSVGTNDYIMLQIGDEHSQDDTLPTIAKTRFSRHAKLKGGKTAPKSIIWPLVMQRHFLQPIEELLSLEGVSEWEDKKEVLLWRGSPTGVDGGDHRLLEGHVDGGVRINFISSKETVRVVPFMLDRPVLASRRVLSDLDMKAQLDYKYLLSLEATKYMENLWMSEKAKKSNNEIAAKLGTMYHAQFNRALKLCT
ncbi:hypothetical protein THAOC_07960 [Thalassiosira oceanica]|uniref:Uncharacterized protein n=1 Tax=Thalassiosira oceanica TaxID=159749 RepID=K0TJA1_THAOC|nr:hypothetical protein THAOC_07960 [Thalassiosira oceanica]|eukprot:EJK70662.1 hypothetical protein THAOC_07960 [Thalassiosira oceanica]